MTEEPIGRLEGALLFLRVCERHDWRFSLTEDGDMHAIIGDDVPIRGGGLMPQQAILATLADLDAEIRQLLRAELAIQ